MKINLTIWLFVLVLCGCGVVPNPPADTEPNDYFNHTESISTPLALPQCLVDDPSSNHFFVALKGQGIAVYSRVNNVSRKVASVPIQDLNNLHVMYLTKKGSYLYAALGDFFKRDSKAGLALIDVSNPGRPVIKDIWVSSEPMEGSAIVQVEGDYAYLGAMKKGVLIFNVSDKNNIRKVSEFQPDIHFPTPNPNSIQHPNARGMDVKGDRLYLCYDAGGIRIIDISNKNAPKEIGRYINTSPNMKQQAYNNIVVHGDYGYIAVDYCGVEVIDLKNPSKIQRVGWWNPWKCNTASNNWFNSLGHSNQIAISPNGQKVYVSTGKSELNVLDVSVPSQPKEVASYGATNNKQATWGMTQSGQNTYLLYITSVVPFKANWAGIKILSEK